MPDGLWVDVAILGGGIAGMTAAALLKEQGFKVAVVEAGRVANLATGHTTAHISAAATPSYYRNIDSMFGEGSARVCARSVLDSIEKIAELVGTRGIDCDFSRATEYLYRADNRVGFGFRDEGAFESRIGLPVSFVESVPLPFETFGALVYRDQAEFHPRNYVLGLAATIPGDGSHVFEGTRATSVVEGDVCRIRAGGASMKARDVVIATGSPISNLGFLPGRMTVRRSYVLSIRTEESIPEHTMFYSSEEPCHYIRSVPSGHLLVGGEDHPTGEERDTRRRYSVMERYCRDRFKVTSIDNSWSTQDQYPFDRLPFIGLLPGSKHQYVATGFKGTGMTYGTLSGMIITNLIAKGRDQYASLYSPRRLDIVASGKRLLKRNLHVAELFAMDRLRTFSTAPSPGKKEAEIVAAEGKRSATFMDESGVLHAVSPVCKHMGCYVRWNNAERTWDCPCHGSRYDVDGNVISAPTTKGLSKRGGRGAEQQR
jgi:glycine/D-amino acid oxidase-like deaminating enzyme/nitrite reductase/ring-hydroxylating ferredoxin subunit